MRKVALDLGKKKITFCELVGKRMIRHTVSDVHSLKALLGEDQPKALVVFEACREAWYVHDLLSSWGNKIIVVDTTRCRQLGIGQHGRKTDRIDAEALLRALMRDGIPPAHVLSPARRELRRCLSIRRALVETRANLVTTARGLAREQGKNLPSCETATFVRHVRAMKLEDALKIVLEPLLQVLEHVNSQIAVVEAELNEWCAKEPLIVQLATAPGVGPIAAAVFISVIDEAGRFKSAHHVESYLGLVPKERSSGGDKRRLGAITKKGNSYARATLTQSAQAILQLAPADDPLKMWAKQVAERRGKRVAVIALARRLVGVLWAMWRRGTTYDPARLLGQSIPGVLDAKRSLEKHEAALNAAKNKESFKRLTRAARTAH